MTTGPVDLHPMARNFYFGADATMVAGSAWFSRLIHGDAAAYGLSEAQALEYGQIDAELQSAYRAATTPATRTPVAVAHKDACVKAMQRRARVLSDIIRATPSVSDAQLVSLGLLPRPARRRRNVPQAPPIVRVLSVMGRVVNLRVCDRDSTSGRSKPFGARGAEIYSYVGEEAPFDVRAYHFEGATTRTSARLVFPDHVPSGAAVWLSARWRSARGETGVGSSPIRFHLQGGPVCAYAKAA